jgi:hypothetical protein
VPFTSKCRAYHTSLISLCRVFDFLLKKHWLIHELDIFKTQNPMEQTYQVLYLKGV